MYAKLIERRPVGAVLRCEPALLEEEEEEEGDDPDLKLLLAPLLGEEECGSGKLGALEGDGSRELLLLLLPPRWEAKTGAKSRAGILGLGGMVFMLVFFFSARSAAARLPLGDYIVDSM